jgi:transposase
MIANALRGHLAEFGIVARQGLKAVRELSRMIDDVGQPLPGTVRYALRALVAQFGEVEERIREIEAQLLAWHRTDETSRRLATIPGVGPITASAIAATVADSSQFRSGREFAAWLGLVPRQRTRCQYICPLGAATYGIRSSVRFDIP